MNLVKFMSREKLVEYLEEELRLFLNAKGIYEINQYGWLTDDRPDPEYMGFAMWQTYPPVNGNKIAKMVDTPDASHFFQKDTEKVFTTGLAFKELMKSARHSIGLTYLYHKDYDHPGHCFSYHFSDAVMKLTMATDRLRELFIEAFSALRGLDLEDLPSSPSAHAFCHPFQQARKKLIENPTYYRELLACVENLLPLVELISFHQSAGLDPEKAFFLTEQEFSVAIDDSENEITEEDQQEASFDGEAVIHNIAEWYKLLITTSNQIFLAVYLLRNFDSNIPRAQTMTSH